MRAPVCAYLGIGANLGDAAASVRAAVQAIAALPGITLSASSSLYCSTPVDSSGPDYVNAVVQVQTTLCAPDLLVQLQALEASAGRERPYRNAPRTLDLDVLLYGSAQVSSPLLTIPHPRMQERAFVLLPLAEIAPQWVSPEQLWAVQGQGIYRL